MKYELNIQSAMAEKKSIFAAIRKLWPIMAPEKKDLIRALVAIVISSGLTLVSPFIVGHTIDTYVVKGDYRGVLLFSGLLLVIFLGAFAANYAQTKFMGTVGQHTLYNLRNAVFKKIQELPVAFFNQNKAGDLISRINNDTDKLNQFFSQALVQFTSNVFLIIGAGIFLLSINIKLGAASLGPALFILVFTRLISGWIRKVNAVSRQATGSLSAEVQESLGSFKVVIAFNRRDYFFSKFSEANGRNFKSAVSAGYANNIYTPVYGLMSNISQLIVLAFGIYLIGAGEFTIGLLVSYLGYVNQFYNPLRQIAAIWAQLQVALASWDRIGAILALESDLVTVPEAGAEDAGARISENTVLEFRDVGFHYEGGSDVLTHADFALERGKTYALVGPTGGGKTTTASLMARLYDPTHGKVLLDGRDIRSFDPAERTKRIGFILQEPYLFTGTVRDNILYGNEEYAKLSNEELEKKLEEAGLRDLLDRFSEGLTTSVTSLGETLSLGQRQLIAFIRAVLRSPEILILDEATANIDTITEQLLSEILEKLPQRTVRVVIAHRLNTIENADQIFFVNGGTITPAGSFDHAVDMLMNQRRAS